MWLVEHSQRVKKPGGIAAPFEIVEFFIDSGDDPDVAGDGADGDVAVFEKIVPAEAEEGFPGVFFGGGEGIDGVGLVGFAEGAFGDERLRITG